MGVPTGTCFECRTEFELPGYDRDYCSEDCFYSSRGDKALNLLRYDHRLCASCGRFLKEVDPPSEDWKHYRESLTELLLDAGAEYTNQDGELVLDATSVNAGKRPTNTESIIGFEDSTPNAENVIKEYGEKEYSIQNILTTGLGCQCGNTDTSVISKTLQGVEMAKVLANYVLTFRALEREGQLSERIDKAMFFESYKETRDLSYSLGVALYK